MVYNAMKLFMEVNPALFDECSHEYTESQNNATARKKERQDKWDKLTSLAKTMQNGTPLPKTITHTSQGIQGPPRQPSPERTGETDALNRDASDRLANLKLQNDVPAFDRQVSSAVR